MLRAIRRIRVTKGALLRALAGALALSAAMASCITGPPPDPPQAPALGAEILQDIVMPSANQYVTELPSEFVVPVRVFNPNIPIACNVFVDFDPGKDNGQSAKGAATTCGPTSPALDGGVTNLSFVLNERDLGDPNACHTIQCFVAESFAPGSPHTSLTADSVTWQYTPDGPGSCAQYDAGDGAFPQDSPSDSGPLILDVVNPPP